MDGNALMFHSTYKDVVTEVSRRIRDWQIEHPWATYLQIDAAIDELVQLARAREREEQQNVVVQPIDIDRIPIVATAACVVTRCRPSQKGDVP